MNNANIISVWIALKKKLKTKQGAKHNKNYNNKKFSRTDTTFFVVVLFQAFFEYSWKEKEIIISEAKFTLTGGELEKQQM